ncbi:MAG: glycoside hydrolase 100 family protein [Bacteroidota bacterium]
MKHFSMLDPALSLLQQATTPFGILASINEETNYRRVWSRDSVICGLAGLVVQDEQVSEGLKQSIRSLGNHQGPQGQLPSNVQLDEQGRRESLSFGGLCGRVDTISWWAIGLCQYLHFHPDEQLKADMAPVLDKGFGLLDAWEFNDKGLVYVPQSGNWADEYLLRGYILFDQLLRVLALKCAAAIYQRSDWHQKADRIKGLLQKNYWITDHSSSDLYHQHAFELAAAQSGPSRYWEASFGPGGYIRYFDLLANALALLLKLPTSEQTEQLLAYTDVVADQMPYGLMPSFWEPILPGQPDWSLLQANYKYHFRNQPYEFQNGGIWPVFNGWWGLALVQAGKTARAQKILEGLRQANQLGNNGFYECLHGQNGQVHGTRQCTWSAAGQLLLQAALEGKSLWVPS